MLVALEARVSTVVFRRAEGATTALVMPERARVVAGDTRLRLDKTPLIRTRDFWTSADRRFFEDVTI